MRFRDAKRLHNEDEVTIKKTGDILTVLCAWVPEDNPKLVLIECNNGNTYNHKEIR